jgi:N-acetylmuramic acid 6-phosphate (MurNAc-6-P) etherase
VNLHQKNIKLTERAVTIVARALEIERERAREVLQRAGRDVPIAIVMAKAGVSRASAERSLKDSRGHVRRAISLAASNKNKS